MVLMTARGQIRGLSFGGLSRPASGHLGEATLPPDGVGGLAERGWTRRFRRKRPNQRRHYAR